MKQYGFLFIIPALIWGSTWYVIKFQLGDVSPLVSVSYRYYLAALIMFSYCLISGANLKLSRKDHFFMLLQGTFLFGINYWMAYEAEVYITSGMMSIAFSTVVFANSFFARVLLKNPIEPKMIVGAVFAVTGTGLIFSSELIHFNFSREVMTGLGIAMLSVILASIGQIVSSRNSAKGIPVLQANSFGMLYGAMIMTLIALFTGQSFTIDLSTSYLLSLGYLSLMGSVVAFGVFLTLISKVGVNKASYSLVMIPVISVSISSVFENYQIGFISVIGVALILIGNVITLRT